jgi:hypothetical protein
MVYIENVTEGVVMPAKVKIGKSQTAARLQLLFLYGGPVWLTRSGKCLRIDKEGIDSHLREIGNVNVKSLLSRMVLNNLISNLTWDVWYFYCDLVLPDWLYYDKSNEENIRDNYIS